VKPDPTQTWPSPDWLALPWTLTLDFVWSLWPWVKSRQNVASPPLCLPLWLFLAAHSSQVREVWRGGDGEQKCQWDIKQSASVCALKVQPVWFPSPVSLPPLPPPHISSIDVSPQSNKFILFSPNLQISLSLLLHQHPYHFFCWSIRPPFALLWFIIAGVRVNTTSNSNKTLLLYYCLVKTSLKRNTNHLLEEVAHYLCNWILNSNKETCFNTASNNQNKSFFCCFVFHVKTAYN